MVLVGHVYALSVLCREIGDSEQQYLIGVMHACDGFVVYWGESFLQVSEWGYPGGGVEFWGSVNNGPFCHNLFDQREVVVSTEVLGDSTEVGACLLVLAIVMFDDCLEGSRCAQVRDISVKSIFCDAVCTRILEGHAFCLGP